MPVIAGVFLLTGGFLTFLFTRSNEDRKAAREQAATWREDLLDRGAHLLDAADTVRSLGLLSLNRTSSQFAQVVVTRGKAAAEELVLKSRRVALVMPSDWEEDLQAVVAWTTMVITPPFQNEGQLFALQKQLEAIRTLESRLRQLRRLAPLKRGDSDHSWLPDMAEKAMASLKEEVARESAVPGEGRPPKSASSGLEADPITPPEDVRKPAIG
ncbi:hypothetical protein [Agromyces aureus]|uniref:hypothetical protein n=1 Tax=Agromyces aureus TaxID=453304 RepID=UPI0012EE1D15|nr:hypothetical protein [Agromyces aureus]